MNRFVTSFVAFLLLTIPASELLASWEVNGNAVSTAAGEQRYQYIATDGNGGAIIVWEDHRDDSRDLYAQRFSPDGLMLWTFDGIPVCSVPQDQLRPVLTEDGAGGAIVAWADNRDGATPGYDIYAQRIDPDGVLLWTIDGIPVCTATGDQHRPYIVPDGEGGAVIVWHDARDGEYHVYGQRLDADGNSLWSLDGEMISKPHAVPGCKQLFPTSVPDGSGGAIVAWHADCYNDMDNREVHVRRIYAAGDSLWPGETILTDFTGGRHNNPAIASDGNGGAIIAWPRNEEYVSYNMYCQRMAPDGSRLWQPGGRILAFSNDRMDYPYAASDGNHGAYITWTDFGENPGSEISDIFIRRVKADGTPDWTSKLLMADASGTQRTGSIISDGEYGAIVSWRDFRHADESDIFAQRVDSTGFLYWGESASPVCVVSNTQALSRLVSDGSAGALICWYDYRSGDNYDIYAQRANPGYSPPPDEYDPLILAVNDIPGDQGGQIAIVWAKSGLDIDGVREIDYYTVWRRISYDDPVYTSGPEPDRDRRVRFLAGSAGYAWEWLMDTPARFFDSYAATIPSLHDSTALGTGWQYFMVSAVAHDPYIFYDSPVDSGYSVDNLSPATPTGLAALQAGSDLRLEWDPNTEEDLLQYAVYRGENGDFTPNPGNLITSPSVNTVIDTEWSPGSNFCYKVSAIDVHGNESEWALVTPEDVVATLLQFFSTTWSSGSIVLSWTVSSLDDGTEFHVFRSDDAGDTWQTLKDGKIARDGMTYAYVDTELLGGHEYTYRVDLSDGEGNRIFFVSEEVHTPEIPLTLNQNYPNPFNPATTIQFYLPKQADVSLSVYDVSGRLVLNLENGTREAGWHTVSWDGSYASGKVAVSGTYFCRLKADKECVTTKMVLIR